MNKTLKIAVLIFAIIFSLAFCGCSEADTADQSSAATLSSATNDKAPLMRITIKEGGTRIKFTEDVETINKITEVFNNAEKVEVTAHNRKGNQISITVKDNDQTLMFSVIGDRVRINGKQYVANTELIKAQIIQIFETIPGEEYNKPGDAPPYLEAY